MTEEIDALKPNLRDHLTAAAKGALGAVPIAGNLLAEIAGEIIPNQRIDRLVRFAEELDSRLSALTQDFLRSQLGDENFTDLIEESMRQAARAVTDERRQYIANLVTNSLTRQSIDYIGSKHILRLLGELNDIEVLWLRYYLYAPLGGDEEFRATHAEVFEAPVETLGAGDSQGQESALQAGYQAHLAQLNLLSSRYVVNAANGQTQFDSRTGAPKFASYEITDLGRLLLREVGFELEGDAD